MLPELERLLTSTDWMELESGILILGAIAEGCTEGMVDHLPGLINQMINVGLKSEKALVRSITCWTLSRYSSWVVKTTLENYACTNSVDEARSEYLQPLVQAFLERILDTSKRVQEAACSAFATLEEEATGELEIYLDEIILTMYEASKTYQAKNLLILYDAIGTLADVVGEPLGNTRHISDLLNELMAKWDRMPTNSSDPRSKDIFALLECLSSIATAIGKKFRIHSQTVFSKSTELIARSLHHVIEYRQQSIACQQAGVPCKMEVPDKDFMIVGLDLLSGVTEGLGKAISEFVKYSNPSVLDLMLECATDSTPEVRQSAFALMGDLTKACYEHIHPKLHKAIPLLVGNITKFQGGYATSLISVCNNATWALGEICVNLNRLKMSRMNIENLEEILNLIDNNSLPIMEHLSRIIQMENMQKTLIENTAITIGRLGLLCPTKCCQYIPRFIRYWCASLQTIRDNEEKYTAFLGLVMMIFENTQILQDLNVFSTICVGIASWWQPPSDLLNHFHKILHGVVDQIPKEEWENIKAQYLPPTVRHRLTQFYNI